MPWQYVAGATLDTRRLPDLVATVRIAVAHLGAPQSASTDDRGDTLNCLDDAPVPRRLQRFIRIKHQTASRAHGRDQIARDAEPI